LRVTHVITSLDTGGAELLLARLLERVDPAEVESHVICLKGAGPVAARIEALGVRVRALDLRKQPLPADFAKLRRAIRESEPDVVQTWMLHANVLGGVTTRLARPSAEGRIPVVWGVHISVVDPGVHGRTAAITQRLEKALSGRVPARIVACSQSAHDVLRRLRYPVGKLDLIPNGFDLERFRPDPEVRAEVRRELGIPEDVLVVGHVARFHPMKDHRTLLAAAETVLARLPDAHFVLCGAEVTDRNPQLRAWAAPLGDRLHLLGERDDVERLYRAFDLMASSSVSGEALPLVIGEAMACVVPVVATRCGDAPQLIGDTGRVVGVRDPEALAAAMLEVLELPPDERRELGEAARRRIGDRYDLGDMVARYVDVWRDVARPSHAASAGG
jgi:glycosyltransferase involved in cell wall biosynthesis